MPTCNKITCTIILPPTETPLPEYKRRYLDSSVSVYVPVPDIPILKTAPAFNIDLRTDDYIAPGLAMFVFIDGVYQANRSRLVPQPGSQGGSGLRMTLRQKEEKIAGGNGGFVGREWRWVELDVERANKAAAGSKDAQSRIGRIEVVVLRCAERVPMEEPQAQKKTAAKTPVKAPSAKVSSAKPHSKAKAASEASLGLGMLGMSTDGACDFSADANPESQQSSLPQTDYDSRYWDGIEGRYKFMKQETSAFTGAEWAPPPFGLDGEGYDQPRVVVNQYGQPYDPRVPYYNTSTSWRPSQQRTSYAPNSAPPAQSRQQPPSQNFRSRPSVLYDAQGKAYDANGNAYLDRAALQQDYAPAPVSFPEQPFVLSQVQPAPYPHSQIQNVPRVHDAHPPQAQHVPAGFGAPPLGHPIQNSHGGVRYYPGAQQPMQQLPHVQHQPQQAVAFAAQQPQIVNPELQRFWIFERAQTIDKVLGLDHRIVLAAVPYLPILQTVPVPEIQGEQIDKLRRHLIYCIERGRWPNGDPMGEVLDLVKSSHEPSKSRSPHRPDKAKTPEKDRDSGTKPEKMMTASEWIAQDAKTPNSDASAGSKSSKHKSKRDEGNYEDKKSDNDSRSTQHFSNDRNDKTGSNDSDSTPPWPDNGDNNAEQGQTGVGWGTPQTNPGDQDNQGDNQQDQGANNWNNGTSGQDDQADDRKGQSDTSSDTDHSSGESNDKTPNAGDGAGWGDVPSTKASSSSRHSKSSTSSNPHAYVQPYFETWRGNTQSTTTKALRQQPREPYAYPAAPAPHLPANKIGDRSHGVQAGKGADYTHRTYRPKYLDSEESPYAVFVFHYRSAEKLEEILGKSVRNDLARIADEVGRGVLMSLPREKLVEELMKAQGKGSGSDNASQKSASQSGGSAAAQDDGWGQESSKSKTESRTKSSKPARPAKKGNKPKVPAAGAWGATPGWGEAGEGKTGKTEGFQADPAGDPNPSGGW